MYRKVINRLLKTADKTPELEGKVRYGRLNLNRALSLNRGYGDDPKSVNGNG